MGDDVSSGTRTVLVTGSPERVAAVGTALEGRSCKVIAVADQDALGAVCASLGQGAIDSYVQLPVNVPSTGDTVVSKLRTFLAGGLLARFDAVSTVLGTLRQNASVVFVAGNLPAEVSAPDDQRARMALMRVLAQAVAADAGSIAVRTVVVEHMRSADEIAAIAIDPANRVKVIADAAERYPEMSYVDWRLEVLSLASIES